MSSTTQQGLSNELRVSPGWETNERMWTGAYIFFLWFNLILPIHENFKVETEKSPLLNLSLTKIGS